MTDLKAADLVIEAAPEDLALKQRLFAEVEALAGPDVPLATNTSNFPIGEVGKNLKHRGRITHKMLDFYVSDRVEELTDGKQTPVNPSPQGVPDYPIAAAGT